MVAGGEAHVAASKLLRKVFLPVDELELIKFHLILDLFDLKGPLSALGLKLADSHKVFLLSVRHSFQQAHHPTTTNPFSRYILSCSSSRCHHSEDEVPGKRAKGVGMHICLHGYMHVLDHGLDDTDLSGLAAVKSPLQVLELGGEVRDAGLHIGLGLHKLLLQLLGLSHKLIKLLANFVLALLLCTITRWHPSQADILKVGTIAASIQCKAVWDQ